MQHLRHYLQSGSAAPGMNFPGFSENNIYNISQYTENEAHGGTAQYGCGIPCMICVPLLPYRAANAMLLLSTAYENYLSVANQSCYPARVLLSRPARSTALRASRRRRMSAPYRPNRCAHHGRNIRDICRCRVHRARQYKFAGDLRADGKPRCGHRAAGRCLP